MKLSRLEVAYKTKTMLHALREGTSAMSLCLQLEAAELAVDVIIWEEEQDRTGARGRTS